MSSSAPSDSRPLFDYSDLELGPNDIRLLRPLSTNRQPEFELIVVARSQAPLFTALSYTWGDGLATEEILLNDARFAIRWNLRSCLENLSIQATLPDVPWEYIWVDAICINQADNSERRSQVLSMDQTYRSANCVSVWLGPLSQFPNPFWSRHCTFGRDSPSDDWTHIIHRMTSHRYWTRVWVIQEFSLGSKVEICWNMERIDWTEFKNHLYAYHLEHGVKDVAALPLLTARHPDRSSPYLQPLLELLVHYRRSSCSNPLDRIFGLLGLLPPGERAVLERFFPDYSLSHKEVVIKTLEHLMLFHPGAVTVYSEEVFVAMGVTSKADMATLYAAAKDSFRSTEKAMLQPKPSDFILNLGLGPPPKSITVPLNQIGHTRLLNEAKRFRQQLLPGIKAHPSEANILLWHFILTGHKGTPYYGGQYWGTLDLPSSYPFDPPAFYMHTPSGRFQSSVRLCFSVSDFHPRQHSPIQSIWSILHSLSYFMMHDEITTGSLSTTAGERRALAARSRWWNSTGGGSTETAAAAAALLAPAGLVNHTGFGDGGAWFRSEWPDLDGENWGRMKANKVDPLTGHGSVIPV